jgi:predicted membrane-bound spermidine synthase
VKPVTDDRPFFNNFFKLSKIETTFTSLGRKWLPFLQGEFLVFLLFIQAIGVAFVLILLPVLLHRKRIITGNPELRKVFLYFGLIGMSFMFVEITMIQKFILFLGHPLYSVAIILFALLFSSGVGSLLSKKILGHNPRHTVIYPLLLAATLILIFNLVSPLLFNMFIGFALLPKMLFTCVVIFPIGFAMGFPFPTGIRLLERTERQIIPWAWATNAFSSVVNSIAALIIAFWGGFNSVLALAAIGYLIAPFFLGFARHGHEHDS